MKRTHRIKYAGRSITVELLGLDDFGGSEWRFKMGKMTATQVWPSWARLGSMIPSVAFALIAAEKESKKK